MKILLSILLVGLFATGGNGQSNSEDQTWVDRLKSTRLLGWNPAFLRRRSTNGWPS